ncbi:hypothetical protein Xcel_0585 [Xylanimonas cellulosilytica DSM 15894]|uniref:Uncharacterized protein n=1 Tax=Xylanimonas cellulosilytica (strain DSM 15894 / JCM 12276 / CECT 5975 / KCTC 9989 / LMG 20990 / NBRC 107835 / XIL07) TaxID=446471 RepID=D1BWP2_XYLCX|nr:hypothetical protein Xcel_0585 [Xylanimonas cellulosilytica DSM 15894]
MTARPALDLAAISARYQAALDAKPSKGGYSEKGIAALQDSVCDVPDLLAALAAATTVGPSHRETQSGPRRMSDTHLHLVATTYRQAWSQGEYPTRAVAQHFGVPHSTAARWVMKARENGQLGPADGRRGGES